MECPSCKGYLNEHHKHSKFCILCGAAFPPDNEKHIQQEVASADRHFKMQSGVSHNMGHQAESLGAATPQLQGEKVSSQTYDTPAKQYCKLLRDVFADNIISPDELVTLARRKNELGITSSEAIELQRVVAYEMGISINEDEDLLSGDLVLEVDVSKLYHVGQGHNLEFRVVNISDDALYNIQIIGKFVHLGVEKNASVIEKRLPAAQRSRSSVFLPFAYDRSVVEVVMLKVDYKDAKNNPCIYESQLNFRVFDKVSDDHEAQKSINITFQAENIIRNDMSRLAEIIGHDAKGQNQSEESFAKNQSQTWQRLPLYFNEDETNQHRNNILIQKKLVEGSEYVGKAQKLLAELGKPAHRDSVKILGERALKEFQAAHAAYTKIREIDSTHEESLSRIRDIEAQQKHLLDALQKIEGPASPGHHARPAKPEISVTSAQMLLPEFSKKIFLYSKPSITLGRNSNNDIVLRLLPNQPESEYPENYRKSLQISSNHAEIISDNGQFYICDVEKNGHGSVNGTFLNGTRAGIRQKGLPIENDSRINIANVLELRCHFLWNAKMNSRQSVGLDCCTTVMGDASSSYFGINKQNPINAIRIVRVNNLSGGEEYLIVLREATIGRSRANAIAIDHESVSDIHAKINFREGRYWIEDLNSRHGTSINGKFLEQGREIPLDMQTDIKIGDVLISFVGK